MPKYKSKVKIIKQEPKPYKRPTMIVTIVKQKAGLKRVTENYHQMKIEKLKNKRAKEKLEK